MRYICRNKSSDRHANIVQPIAKNALTMLINLSAQDEEVLKALTDDNTFIESLLLRITVRPDPTKRLHAHAETQAE